MISITQGLAGLPEAACHLLQRCSLAGKLHACIMGQASDIVDCEVDQLIHQRPEGVVDGSQQLRGHCRESESPGVRACTSAAGKPNQTVHGPRAVGDTRVSANM